MGFSPFLCSLRADWRAGAGQGIGGDQIVLWGLYRGRAHGKLSVLHSTRTTCTTDLNRSEVKRVKSAAALIFCEVSLHLLWHKILLQRCRCDEIKPSMLLKKKAPRERIKSANKKRTQQQQRQQGVSSLELKYNLRRCIYSHTFNKPERCKWVPEYLKGKQKNKGKVSIQQVTLPESQYSSQNSQCSCVSQGTKCRPEEKTVSRISEHPCLYISFFFSFLEYRNSIKH